MFLDGTIIDEREMFKKEKKFETLVNQGKIKCATTTQCDFCLNHYGYLPKHKEYSCCEDCLYKFLQNNHFEFYAKSHRAHFYELINKTTGEN